MGHQAPEGERDPAQHELGTCSLTKGTASTVPTTQAALLCHPWKESTNLGVIKHIFSPLQSTLHPHAFSAHVGPLLFSLILSLGAAAPGAPP